MTKIPTSDPKLDLEPATKLTLQLDVGAVHGHAPIHGCIVNPRTNSVPVSGEEA